MINILDDFLRDNFTHYFVYKAGDCYGGNFYFTCIDSHEEYSDKLCTDATSMHFKTREAILKLLHNLRPEFKGNIVGSYMDVYGYTLDYKDVPVKKLVFNLDSNKIDKLILKEVEVKDVE